MTDDQGEKPQDVSGFLDIMEVVRHDDLRRKHAEPSTMRYPETESAQEPAALTEHHRWVLSNIELAWVCYSISALLIFLMAVADYLGFVTKLLEEKMDLQGAYFLGILNPLLFLAGTMACYFTAQAAMEIREMRNYDLNWEIGIASSLWIGMHLMVVVLRVQDGYRISLFYLLILFAFAIQILGFMTLGSVKHYIQARMSKLQLRP